MNIVKTFYNNIRLIVEENKVNYFLVAISGGQDSIYLINLMEHIKKKINLTQIYIEYIYIDHQWKINSYEQNKHIINYIRLIQQKIHIYQINNVILSENKCRISRYNIIIQHALKYRFKYIITAHSGTDKIETFLLNLIRGCGLEGATSLNIISKFEYNKYLIRPLINTNRESIYWMCKKLYLPIWSDITNYQYNISRNRIRYELIPYLKQYFNQKIDNNIKYVIKNYYYDNEYIKQNAIKLYIVSKHDEYVGLNYSKLRKQHVSMQIKVLQLFCLHNFQIILSINKTQNILQLLNNSDARKKIYIKKMNIKIIINHYWVYITII
uniref:tRNA(Ile)-lysidine synthase, chloroplastic n=1 Tax=Lophocladia kuetzingii TaxID=675577 RepID=A0A1Z1MP78_9FLOR|nr:tRNA Ile-lysidine synthetase [Lophocladia kuetzingii]ARW67585.1 tRNA Ile-lysidine synthetase [Lophocladia kuetzingii]